MHTGERATAFEVGVHLGAVWLLGSVAPVFVVLPTTILLWGAYAPGSVAVVVAVAVVVGLFTAVVRWTGRVSVLGDTIGRQVGWALLVTAGGGLGWGLQWTVLDVVGLPVTGPVHVLGGLPFTLVAGLFLRGWRLRVPAVAVTVVVVGAGIAVLVAEQPVDTLDRRLAAADVRRDTAYVVAVPGYRPVGHDHGGGLGGDSFVPADAAAVPADRWVSVNAFPSVMVGNDMCGQPTALDSQLTWGRCEVEAGGLVYRDNGIVHGYQVPVDGRHVTVAAGPAVARDLLRAGATSIHPATAAELLGHQPDGVLYAVTIPGFTGRPSGTPPGMTYGPADNTGSGAQSVGVRLHVEVGDGAGLCAAALECTADGAGLTYVRREDTHGYALRREHVTVLVTGGLRVDRALLRRAALDARPATDGELFRSLPPAPSQTRLGRILGWFDRGF